jgi:hypothetical protein
MNEKSCLHLPILLTENLVSDGLKRTNLLKVSIRKDFCYCALEYEISLCLLIIKNLTRRSLHHQSVKMFLMNSGMCCVERLRNMDFVTFEIDEASGTIKEDVSATPFGKAVTHRIHSDTTSTI